MHDQPELLVVADDLSGATEAAGAFILRTSRISVRLSDLGASVPVDGSGVPHRVLALDTDTRHLGADAAAERVARVSRGVAGTTVLKKVDSLLRGHPGAETAALAAGLRRVPVVATALPTAGRSVRDGIPLADGLPLASTPLWRAESTPPPATVAEVFDDRPTEVVPLSVVRSSSLPARLAALVASGTTPVCDGETEADLDAVVAAVTPISREVLLVGTGALADALARAMAADPSDLTGSTSPVLTPDPLQDNGSSLVLAVVGSAAPGIPEQLERARARGARVLCLSPDQLLADHPAATADIVALCDEPMVLLALDPAAPVRPEQGRELSAALAAAAAPLAGRARSLVLTGGETARAVLALLGSDHLSPKLAGAQGAVRSLDPSGRVVVTRPGSLGGPDGLVDLLTLAHPHHHPSDRHEPAHLSGREPATTPKEPR